MRRSPSTRLVFKDFTGIFQNRFNDAPRRFGAEQLGHRRLDADVAAGVRPVRRQPGHGLHRERARRDVGDYWVVLDTANEPRYLIRITDVDVRPFDRVGQSFAEREGEGDSSLRYWREVHREYFELQCLEWGVKWIPVLDTVCEGFELIASN